MGGKNLKGRGSGLWRRWCDFCLFPEIQEQDVVSVRYSQKMAMHLQDPFENRPTDTPMTAICFTIERDLKQMINEQPVKEVTIAAVENKKEFYVL